MPAICKQCQRTYEPTLVPAVPESPPLFDPPAYCDECSSQRRLSWLNQYCLHNRACDQCGTDIISMYRPESDYRVYCAGCWQNRNNLSLGYQAAKPFWDQFAELLHKQPLPALINDNNQLSINCAYTNNLTASKNCYFVFDGDKNEDCYYSYSLGESKNSSDCSYCLDAELSYELINCHGCYHSAYLIDSRLATECYFCYDLSNCTNCLFSSGLRNKQYYIFNKAYSKEDYEAYFKEHMQTNSYTQWQLLIKQYLEWLQSVVRKESTNRKNENCIGNDILYCKNSTGFFIHQCEDCNNVLNATTNKNINNGIHISFSELSSECLQVEHSYTSFGSAFCTNAVNNFYSLYCQNCKNVFGCIGLQNQEYCILNQQYSQEEYEQKLIAIISELKNNQTFGQFFPPALSPFSYQETIAHDLFPLLPTSIRDYGYNTQEDSSILTTNQAVAITDLIDNVPTSITTTPLTCESCNKRYRITDHELDFYRRIKVPIPHHCFRCRHQARRARRPNFRMRQRNCSKCEKPIVTHYTDNEAAQVYCHSCYESLVLIN